MIPSSGSPFGFDTGLAEMGGWLAFVLGGLIVAGLFMGVISLLPFYIVLLAGELVFWLGQNVGGKLVKFLLISFRGLRRNLLRTSLTYLATFVLTFVICVIWSVLSFIDMVTSEKETDLKAIVTERFQIPSQMPAKYERDMVEVMKSLPDELRSKDIDNDIMTWSFVGGSIDPNVKTLDTIVFFFAMEPKKIITMQYEKGEITDEEIAELRGKIAIMEKSVKSVLIGPEKLAMMKKQVGDRVKVYCFGFSDIELEVEIIGTCPGDRFAQSAFMNRDYLTLALKDYERKTGKKHPLEEGSGRTLNLIWIRLPNREAFERIANIVNDPAKFSAPSVKMETASSAIGSFLDPFKDILWGARYIFLPAVVMTMCLVVANAISISVRERRTEMAVLKVLGFQPWQLLLLVLAEAILVGALSGIISTLSAFLLVNKALGGVKFPIAFFPKFLVVVDVLWLGPLLGMFTALAGSVIPAWSASRVKASDVFAKVA